MVANYPVNKKGKVCTTLYILLTVIFIAPLALALIAFFQWKYRQLFYA
jgi:hypothetical protein